MFTELYDENYDVKLTKYEKELEKVKRERNRLVGEKKLLIQQMQKREKILETVDMYLTQRIEKLTDANVGATAIHELKMLLRALREERHTCLIKEGDRRD